MRVTCLTCGSQYDVEYGTNSKAVHCECGPLTYPEVIDTGVQPNEKAAERLRYKAFHSAGLVKNSGVVALITSAVGIVLFPIALVGAALGLRTLLSNRGPLGRYAGRPQAMAAIGLGLFVFFAEVALFQGWMKAREDAAVLRYQGTVTEDLRDLLRTQRLFRAAQDRYGGFKDFRFTPRHGHYTLYLGEDDFVAAVRDAHSITDPLLGGVTPRVSPQSFTAVAVANLDGDEVYDVWTLNDKGDVAHISDDSSAADASSTPVAPKPATARGDSPEATGAEQGAELSAQDEANPVARTANPEGQGHAQDEEQQEQEQEQVDPAGAPEGAIAAPSPDPAENAPVP